MVLLRRKIRAVVAAFALILLMGLVTPVSYASNSANVNSGNFDLDVIYVIDHSGSMLSADPNQLAHSASNLFIDMCEDSDTRVGYVMFTHEIVAEQPLTDIFTYSRQLKEAIANTDYAPYGNTDIALGLDRAYELLERDTQGGQSARTPVVILLTDGNTDIPNGNPRTTQQSLEALELSKQKYAAAGWPIYSIGLNYDGRLDIAEITALSDATGAMTREVSSADELPAVLRDIYGHMTGSKSKPTVITATGEPQSLNFSVDNDSIYKGTVTISSVNQLTDVTLVAPDGTVYDENMISTDVTVNKDPLGNYTIFTMYRPDKGGWTLNFTGSRDDKVYIDLMSVYDFTFVMEDVTTATGEATVSWHLEDETGTRITDQSLIDSLTVTLHANGDSVVEAFQPGQESQTFTLAPGDYEAYLTMQSDDINENKRSNTRTFNVPDVPPIEPVELASPGGDTLTVNLITIFKTEDTVSIEDLLEYSRDNEPLSVDIERGDWDEIVRLENGSQLDITATAVTPGKAETAVTVTGADGSSVTVFIETNVSNGLIYIIIGVVVILIIAAVIIILMIAGKPYLDTPMRDFAIEVKSLPDFIEYPQAARLRLEHVKGKRNLQQVIYYNAPVRDEYYEAFRDIGWFLAGTEFSCKRKDVLNIVIPGYPGFVVQINGQNIMRPYISEFGRNTVLRVNIVRDNDNSYEIVLGESNYNPGGGWGPGGGGFDFVDPGSYGGPGAFGGVSPGDFDLV